MKKTLLILAALLCGCFALKAQEQFTSDGLNYRVTGTNPPTVTLTGHTDGESFAAHDFVIPSTVTYDGTIYSVTSIGNDAFAYCINLTGSLTIPNSVTSIGIRAFVYCLNLTGSLTIPNSVTSIGGGAFKECSGFNGTLTIGSSVTSIGTFAFYRCKNLTGSLTIPNSVTSIGASAFEECSGFNGTLTIGSSVTSIKDKAFKNSGFTGSLIIPNSVESIGENAFEVCLGFSGSLTIGNSVTSIGQYAFNVCYGFSGSLTIGSSVTSIGESAFYLCEFADIISKPTTPPDLGPDALGHMTSLETVIVPCGSSDSYKFKDGWNVFVNKIAEDFIQYDLTVVSANTELGTASITQTATCKNQQVTVTATPVAPHHFAYWTENGVQVSTDNPYTFTLESDRHLVANFFSQYDFSAICSTGQTLYYRIIDAEQNYVKIVAPNNDNNYHCWDGFTKPTGQIELSETVTNNSTTYTVTAIGNNAFYQCNGLTGSLAIPNSVKSIGNYAFYNCSGFNGSLTIGNAVTSIGSNAFNGCSGFTGTLTIPNSVTSIGDNVFKECKGFTGSLNIPNSVTSIGQQAFGNCKGFNGTLTIGNAVTSIGVMAFNGCSGFTGTLTFGSSVTSIGDYAFFGCSRFTHIIAKPATPPVLHTNVFEGVTGVQSVTVPCENLQEYQQASNWSTFADIIKGGTFEYELTVASSTPQMGTASITQYSDCTTGSSTVVAMPAENCIFAYWTENGAQVSTDNPYTFTLTSDRNLVANFFRQYDFSAICSTGQRLYYRIIDAEHHWVSIVAPNSDDWHGWDDYTKPAGDITLPEAVEYNGTNYTVTAIGKWAFYRCNGLTGSLTIPNSVTSIEANAFEECSGFTGSLTIGSSVEIIGNYAFQGCSGFNETLTIGSSVTSIGDLAFRNTQFANIIAKPATPPTLGNNAFDGMTESLTVTVPCGKEDDYKASWSVVADKIEEGFVYVLTVASANTDFGTASITWQPDCGKRAEVIAMPADGYKFASWTENGVQVTTENPYIFFMESDRNLVANFTITDQYDFTAICATGQKLYYRIIDEEQLLVSIVAPNGDNNNGWNGYTKPTGQIELPETVTNNNTTYTVAAIGDFAFWGCFGLTGPLNISNSVTSIGNDAFFRCENISSLTIGSSVESIGYDAFWECHGLTGSLTIPNSVTNIGEYAFNDLGCDGTLTIGNAVTNIGVRAFAHSKFAYIISEPTTPPALGDNAFSDMTGLQSIFVHCENLQAYQQASNWSTFASMIKGGNFEYELTVASSNTQMGTASITQYLDCETGLSTVSATPTTHNRFVNWTENNVEVSTENPYTFTLGSDRLLVANFVGNYDFSATCTTSQTLYYRIIDAEQNWVSIVAPKSDNANGWEGYNKPTGEIELPASVTHNGTSYTVTEIGGCAFYQCYGLKGSLSIPNSVTSIEGSAFEECSGFTGSLTIGSSVTSIGPYAFKDCSGFTGSLNIPNFVTNIGEGAFGGCSGFTGSLNIGSSVTSIGNGAFIFCSGFTGSLTIGSSVENIEQVAFNGCNFTNIISKAPTAPTLVPKIPDATYKVYIPTGTSTLQSYQEKWGGHGYIFIQYNREDYHFNGTNGNEWNTAANWKDGEVPAQDSPVVFINADCQVNTDAEVGAIIVAAGKTLTVNAEKTLTTDGVTLENGAQLFNNGTVSSSKLTMKKDIAGYGTGTGGWYLVSSPVGTIGIPSSMRVEPEEDYDIYRFDQSGDNDGNEWINAKAVEGQGIDFYLETLSGYLYANKNNTTIVFPGDFADTDTKTLIYDANADFPGFNLVGNPYPCNATISGENLRSSNYYYRMNADGTDLEVVANPVLAPCTGVFAVAANDQASITFTQADATANVTRGEKGSLQDIRVELLADGKVIDRAYLNTNGESLPKFSLQDNSSEICFYQNKEELAVASTDATRGEMPLNFKAAKNGSYTITVNVDNADLNYLHLVDNLTGNDVDLLGSEGDVARNVSTYTFDAKTDDYASRFKLVFGVNGDAASAGSAGNFAYISNGNLVIDNIEGQATLQIIDVLGRVVSCEIVSGSYNKALNVTPGLYILNLNGMTQKIVAE